LFIFAYYYDFCSVLQLLTTKKMDSGSVSGISEFLFKIRARGRYSFTLDELRSTLTISEKAINQSLFRLKLKGQIAQVRQGFYVIVPPEYSSTGILPIYFFIDQMMGWLARPYYVGLLSAAAMHGSSHQQPMESFIMINSPALRKISHSNMIINFLLKSSWEERDITKKKTDAGYINVSSPELTALDLLLFNNWIGINRATEIISELAEEMKPSNLVQTARRFPVTATIQRLGYVLENGLGNEKMASVLDTVLAGRKSHTVPLSASKERKGKISTRWKIIQNMEIESEL
jgi:predicted transcriptional regulator of viral defense system